METLKEDKNGYVSEAQREVLVQLVTHPVIEGSFFLTGGTALSVFYLNHRLSDDLDFFTLRPLDLGEIDFWIRTQWPKAAVKIKEGPQFLSLLIREVRVDFVVDPLSIDEKRETVMFENGKCLSIDTIKNMLSNKLCAVVSRTEPKDFIDFYMILKAFPNVEIEEMYELSRMKDAIFDDPPTVAYQLEAGIAFIRENPSLVPKMLKQIDWEDFFEFYKNVAKWIYDLLKIR
jgi:predicted nucleotidyltransferase component of viral defense system